MYVVTGATGSVGRLVADELSRRGLKTKLIVRDTTRAPQLAGAEVFAALWDDQAALADVLAPGDRVFMVSLPQSPAERTRLQGSFIEAASKAGVDRIVYLSFMNPSPEAVFHHARSHFTAEQMLAASGVDWVSIRNGMYADDVPDWFDDDGVTRVPVGNSRISFSYRPELADAIVTTLVEDGHAGRVYDITGPEALTMAEVAAIASKVTGDPYRYEPAEVTFWLERYATERLRDDQIEWRLSEFEAQLAGELQVVTDDYRTLTGRRPLGLADVLRRHRHDLPLSRRD